MLKRAEMFSSFFRGVERAIEGFRSQVVAHVRGLPLFLPLAPQLGILPLPSSCCVPYFSSTPPPPGLCVTLLNHLVPCSLPRCLLLLPLPTSSCLCRRSPPDPRA